MTPNPANSTLSSATQPAPALGGPLPPFRVLLGNGNGRGRRAALGFLLHTAVVAVLFLLPLLMTEQMSGNLSWRDVVTVPIQRGDPKGSGLQQKSSGPKQAGRDPQSRSRLTLSNQLIKAQGPGPVLIAGPTGDLDRPGIPDGFDIGEPTASGPLDFQRPFGPAPIAQAPVPIVPGGKVRPPRLLRRAEPDYPTLARTAGIQGRVILEATLGTDGRVEQIVVISGHPLLVEAARWAVAQWVYEPSYLNGRPVPVLLNVTVEFILHR